MPAELDNQEPELDQANPAMDAEMPDDAEVPAETDGNAIGLHGDEVDREGAMAKADLFKLANYSHKLYQQIQDEDQLESWVQAKITKAADYIASVFHYLEYEMKFSEYGHHLDNSDTLSEGQKMKIQEMLAEAKSKVKDLKKAQAEKIKEKKVDEGVMSGGEHPCDACGGTGSVHKPGIQPSSRAKELARKHDVATRAHYAATKRLQAEEDLGEEFTDKSKVGDTFKTRTGVATKTDTGMKHNNTSYADDGEAEQKSGKGVKSHAKAQSAAEKKEKAPAQKMSPKSAKTWGMKDSEKFDNRDKVAEAKSKMAKKDYDQDGKVESGKDEYLGSKIRAAKKAGNLKEGICSACKKNPCVCKKEKKCNECGMYESKCSCSVMEGKPSAGLSKAKKSSVVKKAKAGGDIGKPGKGFAGLAKKAGGGEKGEKIAAAAMWKNIKETTAYIEERAKAAKKKEQMADEGNEFSGELAKAKEQHKDSFKVDGKTYPVKESTELDRVRQLMQRLNG